MSKPREQPAGLVADANVLIDYACADRGVLALISRHLGKIHAASPVFDETNQLSESDAAELGIVIVEPALEQVIEASKADGATSFQDRLCLVLARDRGWAVLTNDTALRKGCAQAGIKCIWGLEAMRILVESGNLTPKRAISVAISIAKINPFITSRILQRFQAQLGV